MHYYKKNIGDYAKKAGRLTMLQHGAYTLLLDACYDRERFPTKRDAIEWTWATTEEEIAAVEFVLQRFFTFEDGVYVQPRIQEEIDNFHAKSKKNKDIALARESTKRARNVHETPRQVQERAPNQEPLTINQEPRTKNHVSTPNGADTKKQANGFNAVDHLVSLQVDEQVARDYCKQRKTKLTLTAVNGLVREAAKASVTLEAALVMCCERNWQGFKADWLTNQSRATGTTNRNAVAFASYTTIFPQQEQSNGRIIDVTPRLG